MMKVLITYFSQTGNTEQVAKAIYEEASQSNEASLIKVEDIKAESLNDYDLVFIGSPIHAGGLAGPVNEFLQALPTKARFKIAGFATHASAAYEKENFEKGMASFEAISKERNIAYVGSFECQGRLVPALHEMVKKSRGVSDEEWDAMMAETDKHPGADDEAKAREFAKRALAEA
jgi:flavodoxin I